MPWWRIGRREVTEEQKRREDALPPELLLLLEAFRKEWEAKFSSLKLWGSLALLGGGTLGGIISRVIAPQQTTSALHAVLHIFT